MIRRGPLKLTRREPLSEPSLPSNLNHPTPPPVTARAGSLEYTFASLRVLFFWLLAGDVMFTLCDNVETRLLPIILKSYHATDTQIALIITSIQSIVTAIAAPIVSYRSDRKRSKWGRRLPYIFWSTPIFTVAMVATPFAPDFAHWFSAVPALERFFLWVHIPSVILIFALITVFYRTSQIIAMSMYFALFRDVVPMTHMGRFLALYRIVGSVCSFAVSFWLIGLVETHSRSIFVVLGIVNLVAFALICFKIKEGEYPPEAPAPSHSQSTSAWRKLQTAVTTFVRESYTSPLFFWTYLARMTAYSSAGILTFIIFFPQQELGISLKDAGMILSAPTALWIFIAYPIGRQLDRLGAGRVMSFFLVVSIISYGLSFFLVTGPITFLISTIIGGVCGWALLLAQLQLAQEIFPLARYGQLSSANQMFTSLVLAFLITPLVGWSLDTIRTKHWVLHLPALGDFPVGPYRSVNLMLAFVFTLSWLSLKQVKRLRAREGPLPAAAPV